MQTRVSRRKFMAAAAATAGMATTVPAVHSFGQERGSELRIGIAADAQFADVKPSGKRHYREGDNRLAEAVAEFNREKVDCCFHLGDLIDRDFASFENSLQSLEPLSVPCHQVLGNHDFVVADDKKVDVPRRMGLPKPYYSQTLDKLRFVMLDGTEVSTFAHSAEDPRTASAQNQLAELKAKKLANAQSWNGGIGARQLLWLLSELQSATEADERVVLMCHYPVFPINPHNLWNDTDLLTIIDDFPCVVAWFNGHNHAGNYGERNGVHFVTMHGIVEDAKSNAFGIATVHDDRIELKGHGRQPDLRLNFRNRKG